MRSPLFPFRFFDIDFSPSHLSHLQERYYVRQIALHNGNPPPEARLPLMLGCCLTLPISLFIFAGTSVEGVHPAGLIVSGVLFGFSLVGICTFFLPRSCDAIFVAVSKIRLTLPNSATQTSAPTPTLPSSSPATPRPVLRPFSAPFLSDRVLTLSPTAMAAKTFLRYVRVSCSSSDSPSHFCRRLPRRRRYRRRCRSPTTSTNSLRLCPFTVRWLVPRCLCGFLACITASATSGAA